jgi:HlyD family secretion protein
MTKKKNNKKWLYIGLGVVLVALIAFAAIRGKGKPQGIPVEFSPVEHRTIYETVSGSGKIFPETEVKISSDVSGEIVELFVEEGDSVVMGQVLARIDPDTYISFVERAEASLNNARAAWATARSQVEGSKAAKEQIQAQIVNARKIYERNKKLHEQQVISDADLEQSYSSLASLEANLRAAEANIRSAQESAKGAEFSVKSFEASLKEARTNLGRTTIKAPMGGIISTLLVEEGERVVGTIQFAGTEMMRIANLQSMEVQVEVSENDILRVELGDSTEIEVDAYLDRTFNGVVTEIANSASNTGTANALNTDQVTNFIVKVRIDPDSYMELLKDGSGYPFRPGMSASVDIFTDVKQDVVSIPIQAVTTRPKNPDAEETSSEDDLKEVVFVVSGDTVGMVDVTTGIQDDEYIFIETGLDTSQTIVSGPYSAVSKKLENGSAVREKKRSENNNDE